MATTSRVFSLRGLRVDTRVQVRANKLAPPYLNIARRDTLCMYVCAYLHTEIAYAHARTNGHKRAGLREYVYIICVYTKQAATSNSKALFKALSLFLLSRL